MARPRNDLKPAVITGLAELSKTAKSPSKGALQQFKDTCKLAGAQQTLRVFRHLDSSTAKVIASCFWECDKRFQPMNRRLAQAPWHRDFDKLVDQFGAISFASRSFWEDLCKLCTSLSDNDVVSPEKLSWALISDALEASKTARQTGHSKGLDVDRDWTPANVKGAAKILEHDLSVGLAVTDKADSADANFFLSDNDDVGVQADDTASHHAPPQLFAASQQTPRKRPPPATSQGQPDCKRRRSSSSLVSKLRNPRQSSHVSSLSTTLNDSVMSVEVARHASEPPDSHPPYSPSQLSWGGFREGSDQSQDQKDAASGQDDAWEDYTSEGCASEEDASEDDASNNGQVDTPDNMQVNAKIELTLSSPAILLSFSKPPASVRQQEDDTLPDQDRAAGVQHDQSHNNDGMSDDRDNPDELVKPHDDLEKPVESNKLDELEKPGQSKQFHELETLDGLDKPGQLDKTEAVDREDKVDNRDGRNHQDMGERPNYEHIALLRPKQKLSTFVLFDILDLLCLPDTQVVLLQTPKSDQWNLCKPPNTRLVHGSCRLVFVPLFREITKHFVLLCFDLESKRTTLADSCQSIEVGDMKKTSRYVGSRLGLDTADWEFYVPLVSLASL